MTATFGWWTQMRLRREWCRIGLLLNRISEIGKSDFEMPMRGERV
jgi:hypothetical protein